MARNYSLNMVQIAHNSYEISAYLIWEADHITTSAYNVNLLTKMNDAFSILTKLIRMCKLAM